MQGVTYADAINILSRSLLGVKEAFRELDDPQKRSLVPTWVFEWKVGYRLIGKSKKCSKDSFDVISVSLSGIWKWRVIEPGGLKDYSAANKKKSFQPMVKTLSHGLLNSPPKNFWDWNSRSSARAFVVLTGSLCHNWSTDTDSCVIIYDWRINTYAPWLPLCWNTFQLHHGYPRCSHSILRQVFLGRTTYRFPRESGFHWMA